MPQVMMPLCPFCVFSLQLCPIRGKTKITGQIPGSIVVIKGPNKNYEGLNAPLRLKGAPLPTLCLLYNNCAPVMGKKQHFGTKYWGNLSFSSTKKGHVLLLKWHLWVRKKGTFWVLKFCGSKRPPPPWFHRPWLCPFRGNEKVSRGQYPGSTVAIRALMWKAKCPIKACPFAHFVLCQLCPSGAKNCI